MSLRNGNGIRFFLLYISQSTVNIISHIANQWLRCTHAKMTLTLGTCSSVWLEEFISYLVSLQKTIFQWNFKVTIFSLTCCLQRLHVSSLFKYWFMQLTTKKQSFRLHFPKVQIIREYNMNNQLQHKTDFCLIFIHLVDLVMASTWRG